MVLARHSWRTDDLPPVTSGLGRRSVLHEVTMNERFPKRLTINLPELQREALQTIQNHETRKEPARILEALLARGIYSKLGTMKETPDGATHEADTAEEQTVALDAVPRFVTLTLDREQRDRIAILLRDTPKADLGSAIFRIFEWGLDSITENLSIAEPPTTGEDEGAE
jgi:hypothetical protein